MFDVPDFRRCYALLLVGAVAGHAGAAEKLLRWKFEPGRQFNLQFVQATQLKTTSAGASLKMSVETAMDVQWTVGQVNPSGAARITQALTRLKLLMATAGGKRIAFDSADRTRSGRPSSELAGAIEAVVGTKVQFNISPRGEISDVELPPEFSGIAAKVPSGSQVQLFSETGLTQIFGRSLPVLPMQVVRQGDRWTETQETSSPIGKLNQKNVYTYEGAGSHEQSLLDKCSLESTIRLSIPADPPGPQMKIQDQQTTGVFLFDAATGHYVESLVKQRLTTEVRGRNKPQQTVTRTTLRMAIEAD